MMLYLSHDLGLQKFKASLLVLLLLFSISYFQRLPFPPPAISVFFVITCKTHNNHCETKSPTRTMHIYVNCNGTITIVNRTFITYKGHWV